MCYAMLALAVDLIWGYCGILSLGHAAFFSLGGYAMGMYLMRQIGPRGVYGDPILPDFMVFLNWKSLPWFWYGFNHFAFAHHFAGLAFYAVIFACYSVGNIIILISYCVSKLVVQRFPYNVKVPVLAKNGRDK